ncbi:hypothetical protein NDU88_010319 [Pleurodeles waltl]|uniref:Uncharacterized protein n=1 Tax=Pleurodeles waltl TaxID=8319 RepID=A0AAV7PYG9_PLEWA|nr:hypothetical protein NDU88_010319 [Pleurodeles waltl]
MPGQGCWSGQRTRSSRACTRLLHVHLLGQRLSTAHVRSREPVWTKAQKQQSMHQAPSCAPAAQMLSTVRARPRAPVGQRLRSSSACTRLLHMHLLGQGLCTACVRPRAPVGTKAQKQQCMHQAPSCAHYSAEALHCACQAKGAGRDKGPEAAEHAPGSFMCTCWGRDSALRMSGQGSRFGQRLRSSRACTRLLHVHLLHRCSALCVPGQERRWDKGSGAAVHVPGSFTCTCWGRGSALHVSGQGRRSGQRLRSSRACTRLLHVHVLGQRLSTFVPGQGCWLGQRLRSSRACTRLLHVHLLGQRLSTARAKPRAPFGTNAQKQRSMNQAPPCACYSAEAQHCTCQAKGASRGKGSEAAAHAPGSFMCTCWGRGSALCMPGQGHRSGQRIRSSRACTRLHHVHLLGQRLSTVHARPRAPVGTKDEKQQSMYQAPSCAPAGAEAQHCTCQAKGAGRDKGTEAAEHAPGSFMCTCWGRGSALRMSGQGRRSGQRLRSSSACTRLLHAHTIVQGLSAARARPRAPVRTKAWKQQRMHQAPSCTHYSAEAQHCTCQVKGTGWDKGAEAAEHAPGSFMCTCWGRGSALRVPSQVRDKCSEAAEHEPGSFMHTL